LTKNLKAGIVEAIILAGGFGTRLQSRLDGIPKPMVSVAGRPFLEILIDRLVDNDFSRVTLSVGYLAGVISGHFGNAWRGVPIGYVVEDEPLGTGGAIRKSMERISAPSTFVLNGDTWLDVDYAAMSELHRRSEALLTLALAQVPDTGRYGGVELRDQQVVSFIEKGQTGPGQRSSGLINGGVYVLSRNFPWPPDLPARFSFETDVLLPHLPSLKHSVFPTSGRFIDIGVPEDLDRAQRDLQSG
jgi:D-glycero-alpha-D-manno-heptose 1-phosphate guanylyltransferase